MNSISVPQREYPPELIQSRAALYSLLPSGGDWIYIGIGVAAIIVLLLLID